MDSLPTADSIKGLANVASLFHTLSFQAQNQAKAVYKNGYPLSDDGVDWILLLQLSSTQIDERAQASIPKVIL